MDNLIKRYIAYIQRERQQSEGVSEDDVNEIKQDISAFRFELLEILKRNCFDTGHANIAQRTTAKNKRKSAMAERQLMKASFKTIPEDSKLEHGANFSHSTGNLSRVTPRHTNAVSRLASAQLPSARGDSRFSRLSRKLTSFGARSKLIGATVAKARHRSTPLSSPSQSHRSAPSTLHSISLELKGAESSGIGVDVFDRSIDRFDPGKTSPVGVAPVSSPSLSSHYTQHQSISMTSSNAHLPSAASSGFEGGQGPASTSARVSTDGTQSPSPSQLPSPGPSIVFPPVLGASTDSGGSSAAVESQKKQLNLNRQHAVEPDPNDVTL